VHNLGRDGTGKTMSECPIVYYSVARLWKIFGHSEFIYRLIVLLLFFGALLLLFKTFEGLLKESVLSMISVLLLFTSPTLIYYANNFLMDIPAFSLAIFGLSFFIRFLQTQMNRHFYLSLLFYTLAGLLKVSSLLSFGAIIGVYLLDLAGFKLLSDRKLFRFPIKTAVFIMAVIAIQIAWYWYASYYNHRYNAGNFLIGILPIWKMNPEQISETLHAIDYHMKWDYFRLETQYLFLFLFVFTLLFCKRTQKVLLWMTIIASIGFVAFIFLFFDALKDHDYYTVNLFILVPLTLLTFLMLLKERFPVLFRSAIFWIVALSFLIHNVDFGRRRISGRYDTVGWHNEAYLNQYQAFRELPAYLRSIGISEEDKVISISDNSINISLYLMNQKGWTNYNIKSNPKLVERMISQGAKYLMVSIPESYAEEGLQPFFQKKTGQFRNIHIYELGLSR
jgi:hypothetical protein